MISENVSSQACSCNTEYKEHSMISVTIHSTDRVRSSNVTPSSCSKLGWRRCVSTSISFKNAALTATRSSSLISNAPVKAWRRLQATVVPRHTPLRTWYTHTAQGNSATVRELAGSEVCGAAAATATHLAVCSATQHILFATQHEDGGLRDHPLHTRNLLC